MVYLKEANYDDIEEEFKYFNQMPRLEKGFENEYFGIAKEDFIPNCLDKVINHSKGIDLKEGYVPDTYFFLWDDEKIVASLR